MGRAVISRRHFLKTHFQKLLSDLHTDISLKLVGFAQLPKFLGIYNLLKMAALFRAEGP